MLLLLFVLATGDNAAEAGAAYKEAQQALAESRHDDAVRKLQEAVRLEPRETSRLLYRDREGRQRIPYHPHYVWSEARAAQARGDADPARRLRLLREALTHLELSEHPDAAARLNPLRRELADAEKTAAPEVDEPLLRLRSELAALSDQERFEEAIARLQQEKAAERHPGGRAALAEPLDARRRSVLTRYDRARILALETADPALLEAALVPVTVSRDPGPRDAWLRGFIALHKKRPGPEELEAAAAGAVDVGLGAGFRAAVRQADALREARLAGLWSRGQEKTVESVLTEIEQALLRRQEKLAASALPADERRLGEAQGLLPLQGLLARSRERLLERRQLEKDLRDGLGRAESALADGSTMTQPEQLRTRAKELAALEQHARWEELPKELAAATLYAGVVLELAAALLSGDVADALKEDAAARVRKARALDPAVDAAWKDRLSPKLRSCLPV